MSPMEPLKLTSSLRLTVLLDQFPFLLDDLITFNAKFKRFQNLILRATVGKKATLFDVAQVGDVKIGALLEIIQKSITSHTRQPVVVETSADVATQSGWSDDVHRKRDFLKALVLELHQGGNLKELKDRFKKEFGEVSSTDIAQMEQSLIDNGELTAEQITKLCDLHVGIFSEALLLQKKPQTTPGHPIHTYLAENRAVEDQLKGIQTQFSPDKLKRLQQIDLHYTRLENQLFPVLEQHHFTGPSQVMWAKHDEIRAIFKALTVTSIPSLEQLHELYTSIRDMIVKEEQILFPTALEMLSQEEWEKVRRGEEEIGYAWIQPGSEWHPLSPADIHITSHPSASTTISLPNSASVIKLHTGTLTVDQIDLLLTHLPVDISFINDQDEVMYYSDTSERIFPRSAGVIGRKVQNCHPPKSVAIVQRILNAFKAGTKDQAEFWIQLDRKFLHIRYFAVRDSSKTYQGTLEITQDITTIRQLEGNRRLLDWSDE